MPRIGIITIALDRQVSEMETYLFGTGYEAFISWLTNRKNLHRFDTDHDGTIDAAELETAIKRYMETCPEFYE